jgi:cell division transport system ATP-binding protein
MLKVSHIAKSYKANDPILRDISFTLGKGEMAVLIGPSGAGKSTVLKMIYREEKPDSGEIMLGDFNVTKIKNHQIPYLRRHLGVIFQDFKLIPERTTWENVALALEVVGKSKREISSRVTELLKLVGLLHRKGNYPHQLSGGERQRVAIARALANQPLLLLADEPTGNLDHDNAQSLLELLSKINVQGCSVLMATHNVELIASLPYRKLNLENGVIAGVKA